MSSLVGRILADRYRVDTFIGRGGMAEVYKVWDSRRMTFLAMKVLHEDLAIDRVFMRRFKREAQTLEKLQHPNIVRFYGLEQDGPTAFMLLDYVEGKTLKRAIFDAGELLQSEQLRFIMRSVCGALQFAHSEGLAHCDIKPANIMLHQNGTVLLADFGIARMTDSATATMVGAGTPAYMAPEQVRGEDPTPQTDVYALGIVLYEMLTGGERPFTGEQATTTGSTGEKVRWEQLHLSPPSPRKWNPDLSPELETVVLNSLQKDLKERYKTALDLYNALESATGTVEAIEDERPQTQPEPAPIEEAASPPKAEQREKVPKPTPLPEKSPTKSAPSRNKSFWLAGAGIILLILSIGWLMGGGAAKAFPTKTPTLTFTPTKTATPTFTLTPVATNTPLASATPALSIGSAWKRPIDGMTMLYIPAGEFEMGSNDGDSDEEPIHTVYLDAYWMDETEVTNAMFLKCVNVGNCDNPGGSYYSDSAYSNHPVAYVSWYDAKAYCSWAGGRLPSEAEWEKAARGNLEGKTYPWGDQLPICAEDADNGAKFDDNAKCDRTGTEPVGRFRTNGYGLFDTSGNVWEWVNDRYDSRYYSNSPSNNPSGPSSGNVRVLRGGSWASYDVGNIRSAVRFRSFPVSAAYNFGFRCSRSLP